MAWSDPCLQPRRFQESQRLRLCAMTRASTGPAEKHGSSFNQGHCFVIAPLGWIGPSFRPGELVNFAPWHTRFAPVDDRLRQSALVWSGRSVQYQGNRSSSARGPSGECDNRLARRTFGSFARFTSWAHAPVGRKGAANVLTGAKCGGSGGGIRTCNQAVNLPLRQSSS